MKKKLIILATTAMLGMVFATTPVFAGGPYNYPAKPAQIAKTGPHALADYMKDAGPFGLYVKENLASNASTSDPGYVADVVHERIIPIP